MAYSCMLYCKCISHICYTDGNNLHLFNQTHRQSHHAITVECNGFKCIKSTSCLIADMYVIQQIVLFRHPSPPHFIGLSSTYLSCMERQHNYTWNGNCAYVETILKLYYKWVTNSIKMGNIEQQCSLWKT